MALTTTGLKKVKKKRYDAQGKLIKTKPTKKKTSPKKKIGSQLLSAPRNPAPGSGGSYDSPQPQKKPGGSGGVGQPPPPKRKKTPGGTGGGQASYKPAPGAKKKPKSKKKPANFKPMPKFKPKPGASKLKPVRPKAKPKPRSKPKRKQWIRGDR